MAELGEHLRAAREARGLTVAEVARGTHIRAVHIEALEQERFGDLPAPVYTRGFLRNYATFLGLDAEDMVAEFDHLQNGKRPPKRSRGGPDLSGPVWPGPSPRAMLGALTLIVLVGFVAFLFHQYSEFAATRQTAVFAASPSPTPALPPLAAQPIPTVTPIPTLPPSPAAIGPSPTAKPAPTQPATAAPAVAATATPAPARPTATPVAPTPTQTASLAVTMQVLQPCWLRVTVDGKIVFEGTLQPKTTRTWDGAKFITVRYGNAGGVMVTFNGQDEGIPGSPGQVVDKTYR